MDKPQLEEMRDFFSQKITYEEISAILQAIYPSVRGYSVKSAKSDTQKSCVMNTVSGKSHEKKIKLI